jgi:hypothetical protein
LSVPLRSRPCSFDGQHLVLTLCEDETYAAL